jgi:hypothetical protein
MTIVQRPYPPSWSPPQQGDYLAARHAQRGLVGLWVPSSQPAGKYLPNLARRFADLSITATWRNTRGGIALYGNSGGSFGVPVFPVSGAERPFSFWIRGIRGDAAGVELIAQFTTAHADRMTCRIRSGGIFRYSHPTDIDTVALIPIGSIFQIGISEQPGVVQRLYVNGLLAQVGAASTGRCSPTNTTMTASGTNDLLAIAIWAGRALQPRDFLDLHHNPNLLTMPSEEPPVSAILAPPSGVDEPYHRRIDWPNRPWWRRWTYRKRNY